MIWYKQHVSALSDIITDLPHLFDQQIKLSSEIMGLPNILILFTDILIFFEFFFALV